MILLYIYLIFKYPNKTFLFFFLSTDMLSFISIQFLLSFDMLSFISIQYLLSKFDTYVSRISSSSISSISSSSSILLNLLLAFQVPCTLFNGVISFFVAFLFGTRARIKFSSTPSFFASRSHFHWTHESRVRPT